MGGEKNRLAEKGSKSLFGLFCFREGLQRIQRNFARFEKLKETAAVECSPIRNPIAIRFFALGSQVIVVMVAILAAVEVTAATGAKSVFRLDFNR
ncbi:hypothetical protein EBT16_03980 [bacterium]|nr:hypothetical protein [bacterium]